MTPAWALAALLAQTPAGNVSVILDHLPNRDTTEVRARAFAEVRAEPGSRIRLAASGFVEGLVRGRDGTHAAAVAEPQELNVTFHSRRLDVTAGLGRVVWGRLDEIQPTDVVNPIDVSRFFFEGRSEARLSVPLVRAVLYAGDRASVEAVYVPFFRRGRFDRLGEDTSPFDLAPEVPFVDRPPARTAANAQGGGRVNVTTGRVDWSITAYRGFRTFGLYSLTGPSSVERIYPRFTMIGGDFETVSGPWGVRGEAAAYVRDAFQAPGVAAVLSGRSFDAGAGVDRRAGSYRVSGQLLFHREDYESGAPPPGADTGEGRPVDRSLGGGRTDVSLVVSTDRSFARQRYETRIFGVYNASEESAFFRGIATANLRDNVALEGSIGWFAGAGADNISRFSDSDFLYVRLKYFF